MIESERDRCFYNIKYIVLKSKIILNKFIDFTYFPQVSYDIYVRIHVYVLRINLLVCFYTVLFSVIAPLHRRKTIQNIRTDH